MSDTAGLAIVDRMAPTLQQRLLAIMENPAVRRARPAILAMVSIVAVLLLWLVLRTPEWRPLYAELSDGDKAAVATALQAGNYTSRIDPDTGNVEVAAADVAAARILLAGQGLPKSARPLDPVGDMPLGLSRAVEAARLKGAAATELGASIEAIDGVRHATVHIASSEPSVFVRDRSPATASVFVSLAPGRVLGNAQVRAIVWLVSSSVAGLAPDKVSVVDQSGALLSAGAGEGESAQLDYQLHIEAMVRDRLFKLLTPLLGPGRFTAEVAADVDFSLNEATSERFARDGSVLRSETANRAIDTSAVPAKGIPGALSNTAPAAAQLTATPPAAAAAAAPLPTITSETTNRAWEIGKDVSVTHGNAPRLHRLSVAVVIDKLALAKATPQEIAGLNRIVQGAIGFDASRGDSVEVQLRSFAVPTPDPVPSWYEKPALQSYAPAAAIGVLGLVGGALALVLSRRRRGASPSLIDGGELLAETINPLPQLVDYREKLGLTRDLVSGDADRATAVARQMLAAEL